MPRWETMFIYPRLPVVTNAPKYRRAKAYSFGFLDGSRQKGHVFAFSPRSAAQQKLFCRLRSFKLPLHLSKSLPLPIHYARVFHFSTPQKGTSFLLVLDRCKICWGKFVDLFVSRIGAETQKRHGNGGRNKQNINDTKRQVGIDLDSQNQTIR